MRNILLIGFYVVLLLKEVFGESKNEIKRGTYPFMAVVYYADSTIVGPSGVRFTRNAILIRPEWLISSSLETNDTQLAFPQKTLMVRAGAVTIDSNFTINEEEGEQEREIIQIVRPTNFTANQWWTSDISLLKILLPFMMTPTVAPTTLSVKHDYMGKTCFILVFATKYKNTTDDKVLMKLTVELIPTSNENCGVHFRNETMICASNSDENNNYIYESDFCNSNGGGPLMCGGEVIGLQTYIANNCKQPYLYQLLSAWDDFITCGIEHKCRLQQCINICKSIDKDEEVMTFGANDIVTMSSSEAPKNIIIERTTKESNYEEHSIMPDTKKPEVMLLNINETPTITTLLTTKITTVKERTTIATTVNEEKATRIIENSETWPKERFVGHRKKLDDDESSENIERPTNVEAQQHEVKKKGRNAAEGQVNSKMGMIYIIELLFFICIN